MYVIYHCVSVYHILQAIVHSQVYHATDSRVLITANFTRNKFENLNEVIPNYFESIIEIPYRDIGNDPNTIIHKITEYLDDKLKDILTQLDSVYIAAAHYSFSLYMMEKGIPFYFMEDGCGILSKPKVSYDIVQGYDSMQADIMQTYGMFDGNNKYVKGIICNANAQSFKLPFDVIDFDIVHEMLLLPNEVQEFLIDLFRAPRIKENLSEYAIVFTQQFANLGILSFEKQIAIYQMAVDFFLNGKKIMIKSHPDDVMFYDNILNNIKKLEGRFPAELIPLITSGTMETSFTIFSSSVLGIKSGFKTNIFCGYDYDKTFWKTDRYYHALKLLIYLNINGNICTLGVDNKIINNLCQYKLPELKKLEIIHKKELDPSHDFCMTIIDSIQFISDEVTNKNKNMNFDYTEQEIVFSDPEKSQVIIKSKINRNNINTNDMIENKPINVIEYLENALNNEIIIFLNTEGDYCFWDYFHKDLFNYIVPIKVEIERKKTNIYVNDKNFVIYVFSKSLEVRNRVKQYETEDQFDNLGIKEIVHPMNEDKLRIAILEGMLEATEKRLQSYIDKEQKLKEKK